MRILIVGSGAREHAIARALAAEDAGHDLVVAPGNAGIAEFAELRPVQATDPAAVSELASFTNRPLLYVVFPVLMWGAMRFDQRIATLAVATAIGFTVYNASERVGAFAFRSVSHMVIDMQLFISVAALTTLCLAAVIS